MPLDLNYKPLRMTLEIPSLYLTTEIVEVPEVDGEYPFKWLGNKAGALQGYALPGEGKAILTGHNHLNTMEAGPFAFLSELAIGDRIFVRDQNGGVQIYTVYVNEKIDEADFEEFYRISDMDEHSLTLITCEDERIEGGYEHRRVVAAKPLSE